MIMSIINLLGVPQNITGGDRKFGRSCDESRRVISLYFCSSTEPQTDFQTSLGFYYSRGYYYARTTTKKRKR